MKMTLISHRKKHGVICAYCIPFFFWTSLHQNEKIMLDEHRLVIHGQRNLSLTFFKSMHSDQYHGINISDQKFEAQHSKQMIVYF